MSTDPDKAAQVRKISGIKRQVHLTVSAIIHKNIDFTIFVSYK